MFAGIKTSLLMAAEDKMLASNSTAICEGNRQDQTMGCAADYLGVKFVSSETR